MKEGYTKMKKAISNLLKRLEEHIVLFVIFGCIFTGVLTFYASTTATANSSKSPSSSIESDMSSPIQSENILQYSSALEGEKGGAYTITSDEKGVICTGYAFTTREKAYQHPIIINNSNVMVTLMIPCQTEEGIKKEEICSCYVNIGKSSLVQYPNYDSCFIYVTVKQSDYTQSSSLHKCVEQYSSAPLEKASGMYTVLQEESGNVCIGNAYNSAASAYANPVIITAETATINLTDCSEKNTISRELTASNPYLSKELLNISNSTYIYVVLKSPET